MGTSVEARAIQGLNLTNARRRPVLEQAQVTTSSAIMHSLTDDLRERG